MTKSSWYEQHGRHRLNLSLHFSDQSYIWDHLPLSASLDTLHNSRFSVEKLLFSGKTSRNVKGKMLSKVVPEIQRGSTLCHSVRVNKDFSTLNIKMHAAAASENAQISFMSSMPPLLPLSTMMK